MTDFPQLLEKIAIWAPPVLLAITVHEAAHGYAARALGDDTAARAGRLSLNPIRHVDPVGTIAVPALLLFFGGFLFGWAKPVPVDFNRLRSPLRDMGLVAAAGPGANLAMLLGWVLLLLVLQYAGGGLAQNPFASQMGLAGVSINLVLMVLNLLPLPPLDGGRIAVAVLPPALAGPLSRVEPWGMPILVLLMISGVLGTILYWPVTQIQTLVYGLLSLPVG